MAWSITLNGTTYTDADMAGYGYITKLPAMLSDAVLDLAGKVSSAASSQTAAAASAVTAVNAPGTSGTSTTSLAIGTGSKSLTTQTGKAWVVGQPVVIADTAAPATNNMAGTITAYTSGTGAMTVDVTMISGSGTKTAWTIGLSGARGANGADGAGPMVTRTSNTILGAGDKGKFINATSGTWTQTFSAAATLGAGWYCWYKNSGTGDITLDPNAAELIDGLASFIMYPGEMRLISCDGAALTSVVLNPFYKVFTSTDTFVKAPGYLKFDGLLWGGGSSGCKQNAASNKPGGPGGACASFSYLASEVSATETVTVGSGGVAVTAEPSNGNAGGTTTFKGVSAYGGSAPTYGSTNASGGASVFSGAGVGNSHVFGFGNTSGNSGITEFGGASAITTAGSFSRTYYGGAPGGSIDSTDGINSSGSTVLGGAGGAAALASSGSDGTAPGGGGGSTKSGASTGAGARGEVRIWGGC